MQYLKSEAPGEKVASRSDKAYITRAVMVYHSWHCPWPKTYPLMVRQPSNIWIPSDILRPLLYNHREPFPNSVTCHLGVALVEGGHHARIGDY